MKPFDPKTHAPASEQQRRISEAVRNHYRDVSYMERRIGYIKAWLQASKSRPVLGSD